ncbi:MAG: hypothetical protein HQL13_05800, partial [Candidatus Omnitrophica bacterium]|nr:hypothetical protein [Candidatus Omnitrophota bacterium]
VLASGKGSNLKAMIDAIRNGQIKAELKVVISDKKEAFCLEHAIKGRGAFRGFKEKIHEYGIEQDWYQYRDKAYTAFAKQWCEDNDLKFVEN